MRLRLFCRLILQALFKNGTRVQKECVKNAAPFLKKIKINGIQPFAYRVKLNYFLDKLCPTFFHFFYLQAKNYGLYYKKPLNRSREAVKVKDIGCTPSLCASLVQGFFDSLPLRQSGEAGKAWRKSCISVRARRPLPQRAGFFGERKGLRACR
jgi:hypothetical protein